MRKTVLLAGIVAGATLPIVALAQPYDPGCVESNHARHVAGTVVGGVLGAVIGSNVAGHGARTGGAIVGGATGALAGNAISHAGDHPCPAGYVYEGPPPQPAAYGFWAGAPASIRERIDFLQRRLDYSSERGWISPYDYRRLEAQLNDIRRQEDQLRDRDGGHLYSADREYLQNRLDDLTQRFRWEASG
ncbi:MAG TPA: glycine zipper 2TM domain-containing protein [Caulobacteraceae bacterium]|nr:glycine zipper 2TM domain-containing protein [Caulobacteraceae bacterium]